MYALCHNPARLSEPLQERCWVAAGRAALELKKEHEREPFTTMTVLQLRESVQALAAIPGPVRDRHRAEFAAARELVQLAHEESLSIPVLDGSDWVAAGAK